LEFERIIAIIYESDPFPQSRLRVTMKNIFTPSLRSSSGALNALSHNLLNRSKSIHEKNDAQKVSPSYFKSYIWPGLGLFGESYLLFSIGTLDPIFKILYPQCYYQDDDKNEDGTCPNSIILGLSYSIVSGIILGMILIGIIASCVGRRYGSIGTALLMSLCSVLMTSLVLIQPEHPYYNDNVNNYYDANDINDSFGNPARLFRWMNVLLFGFGVGVGGEYPLSASSASEKSMEELEKREKAEEAIIMQREQCGNGKETSHEEVEMTPSTPPITTVTYPKTDRGKRVIYIFSMQGMGIFVQSVALAFLLFITGQLGGKQYFHDDNGDGKYYDNNNIYYNAEQQQYYKDNNGHYDHAQLLRIWQSIYGMGSIILLYVLISRYHQLEESAVWIQDCIRQKEQQNQQERVCDSSAVTTTTKITSTMKQIRLMRQYYGMRLFGTCTTWFLWDISFYGNKLFQSAFIMTLLDTSSVDDDEDGSTIFEVSSGKFFGRYKNILVVCFYG